MKTTGDFLLAFRVQLGRLPSRLGNNGWRSVQLDAGWELLEQPPEAAWKGYPLKVLNSPTWQAYLLGSLHTPAAALDEPLFSQLRNLSEIIPGLNGHFLVFAWSRLERQWHAWTDRFATLHAYYATDGRRAALGTFCPAVAAAASSRRLDWEALAGFFGFGFFPNDRTHYTGVRILRPASHYVFDELGRLLRQERYWQWRHTPDARCSYADSVAGFAQVFSQVIQDLTCDGRVAIPISGGLDSRSTVAALTRPGETPPDTFWSYSYGYEDGSIETGLARRVARARDLPFQAYTIRPYLFDRLDEILAWTEGFQDVTLPRQAFVRDELASRADSLVSALWGDVWLDDMGLAGQPAGELNELTIQRHALKKMRKRGGDWLLENIAAPQLKGVDLADMLEGMIGEELRPLAHISDPDFRLKAYKTEQWSFRWSLGPVRVFQSAAAPLLVFYDTRLADFFCSLPTEFIAGRRLQIDYLKRYSPDLARIPWQVYDASLYTYSHFNTWLLPRRALKKARRVLTRQKVIERNWEVQFLCESGRRGLQDWILRPGLRLHEFVSPESLAGFLEVFHRPPLDPDRGYAVAMLLSLSAWLERYG
jgi:asparagine synthase (glutamine-hydrolysing)